MSRTSQLLIRVAIAFAFLYPAYGFLSDPNEWVGYIPSFVQQAGIQLGTLFLILAISHVIVALWILSGWRIFLPSLAAALFLVAVVYFNWGQLDELFRDISLALTSLALAFSNRN